jgi:hypothetical protein
MENNVVFNNGKTITVTFNDMLRVTALLYLKDALIKEEYEGCAELIKAAKSFGARQSEVSKVLTEYKFKLKAARQNEANQFNGGRLRFRF